MIPDLRINLDTSTTIHTSIRRVEWESFARGNQGRYIARFAAAWPKHRYARIGENKSRRNINGRQIIWR